MQFKTEKQGFTDKIKALPYSIMNRYVKSHDNTEKFQDMYSGPWFIAYGIMLVVTVICFYVDYSVLYGIEYTSSLDAKYSFWSAFGSASIIQFLILIGGGLFFKILIFGKLRTVTDENKSFPQSINKNHFLQAVIFGSLFLYGFSWTIQLSQKTYFSAKANAIGNQITLEQDYKTDASLLSVERKSKIEALERTANKTIQSKEVHYNSLIASVVAKYEAKKGKVTADYNKGKYTKPQMNRHLSSYDAKSEIEKAALLIQKENAIAPIQEQLSTKVAEVNSLYATYEKSLDYKASNNRSALNSEIEATAKETEGRNVTYNLVNVILMIGLLLFSKDSLSDTAKPTGSDDDTQTDEHKPRNTGSAPPKNTDSQTGHTTDTQKAKHEEKAPEKTQNETVTTDEHSKTQNTVGEFIEFDDLEENTAKEAEYYKRDGYEFKKENGSVYIKHGKSYARLPLLKTWLATYNGRVDKYTREGKIKLVKKNATMAALISQKINYMKQNFVNEYTGFTAQNKQAGSMHIAKSA